MGYLAQLYAAARDDQPQGGQPAELARERRARFALLDEPPDVPRSAGRAAARAGGGGASSSARLASPTTATGRCCRTSRSRSSPGTRVGIAGPTGAGKTTLMSLLTRFYDPTAGRILLDGVDLRDYRLADLRNQFAIVLQEPVLFSTSDRREHRLRRPGRRRRGDRARPPRRPTPTTSSRGFPDGYDTRGRRARHAPLGRRAPAHLARARVPEGRPDPDPRRAHELGRRRDRGG